MMTKRKNMTPTHGLATPAHATGYAGGNGLKNLLRRATSLALTAALTLGLASNASAMVVQHNVTAGSITVMDAVEGASYTAYRLFDLEVVAESRIRDVDMATEMQFYGLNSAGSTETETETTFDAAAWFEENGYMYSISVNSPWFDFFQTGAGSEFVDLIDATGYGYIYAVAAKGDFGSEDTNVAQAAAARLAALAKAAKPAANQSNQGVLSLASSDKPSSGSQISRPVWQYDLTTMPESESAVDLASLPGYTASNTGYIAQVTGVAAGYYLVDSAVGALCAMDSTDLDVVVYDKNVRSSMVKEVENRTEGVLGMVSMGKTNTASIGSMVNFQVTIYPGASVLGIPTEYKVVREYYVMKDTGADKIGTVTLKEQKGTVGDELDGSTLDAANPSWRERAMDGINKTFTYVSSNPESLTLGVNAADNVITMRYELPDTYTVVYTDGVPDEVVFEDDLHPDLEAGAATPAFAGSLERAGYTFEGWGPTVNPVVAAGDADGNGVITYTATWQKKSYTVRYTDGVDGEEVFADQEYVGKAWEATPTFDGTPTRSNYKFMRWEPGTTTINPSLADENGVITYTAVWGFQVNYTDGANGELFGGQTKLVDEGAPTPPCTKKLVRDGYRFVGWRNSKTNSINWNPTASVDDAFESGSILYKAEWELVEEGNYIVAFDSNGGTSVSSQTVEPGKTANVPAAPTREGYTFVEWTLNGETYDFAQPVNESITLTARWSENYNPPIPQANQVPQGVLSLLRSAPAARATTIPEKGLFLEDIMDPGLTWNEDYGVYATLWDADGNYKGDVELTMMPTANNGFACVISTVNCELGDYIEIRYSAYLNKDAVIGAPGNVNYAALYENGNQVAEDTTTTYTFAFDLVKINNEGEVLDGAAFSFTQGVLSLLGSEMEIDGEPMMVIAKTGLNVVKVSDGVYRVADQTEYTALGFVSDPIEAGHVTILGLGAGSYTLIEDEAPDGYNKLIDPVSFSITADGVGSAIYDGSAALLIGRNMSDLGATVVDGTYISGGLAIVNLTGAELPHTGGMGTTMLYLVGGVLVAAAGILLVARKRMSYEEE